MHDSKYLKQKFDCLEIIHFLCLRQDYYCIWYSDDQDGFFTEQDHLITFATENAAKEFITSNTVYQEPVSMTVYDMNAVIQIIDQKQPLDVCIILEFWNIAADMAGSVKMPFLGDSKDDLTDLIYDKLFFGNNLPTINTSGDIYTPEFTEEEYSKLNDILLDGIYLITNVSKVWHNALLD